MKQVVKYGPWVLCVALFFVGRISSPKPDKELIRKYEMEREFHRLQITTLNAKLADRDKSGLAILEKMKSDSLKSADALRANKEAYLTLKKRYNEINLNRADSHLLDSLVSRLYPD